MSITISFTMEPKMSLTGTKPWDGEQTAGFTKGLAKELGYHCDVISGYVVYQLCPEGFFVDDLEGKAAGGDCQTNIAGPGFHAAVVYFLELFAARGSLKLSVKDPTGFYADRNFERMRRSISTAGLRSCSTPLCPGWGRARASWCAGLRTITCPRSSRGS